MFTGIVEEVGRLARIESLPGDPSADAAEDEQPVRVDITAARAVEGTNPGDSIAVNGVCLTVADLYATGFRADVMPETLRRTTLGRLAPGSAVNLERAVTPATRLGGHIVQGHVDGVGQIVSRSPTGDFDEIVISVPGQLARYLAPKGSICVDGVSLTVVGVGADDDTHWFSVALMPTTLSHSTLGTLATGGSVNLEVDVIAKYVERILSAGNG
jgi:riboflavin synthase